MVNPKTLINSIFISIIIILVFILGMGHGFSWKIGWSLLTIFSFSMIIHNAYITLVKKKIVTHLLLFNAGIFIFIIINPFLALILGKDFPSILNDVSNNYISNKTGLIVSLYLLTFYLGALISESKIKKEYFLIKNSKKIHVGLLISFILLSVIPFFFYGSGGFTENFLNNILARQSGYVAFSSRGLGSQNPIIILLIQFLPTILLVLGVLFFENKGFKRLLIVTLILILMLLYISLGGRGGVTMIILSLIFYYNFRPSKKKFMVFNILTIFFITIQILSYQINSREQNTNNQRSGIDGSDLNKEIAYISEHYGETISFTDSDNILESIIKPIPQFLILLITNPIPRIIWQNKPYDTSFGKYNRLRLGTTGHNTGSNITPTIPGRFYMKYGFIGVLQIGLIVGFIWGLINQQIYLNYRNNNSLIIISISISVTLFICTRELTPGKFYPVIFLYLFYKINSMLMKKS